MLPEQRVAAARDFQGPVADHQPARQEEAGPRHLVHELQDARRFERRKREQQQEARHELRPDEERQPEEAETLGPELHDGHDEVDRTEQRRRDQEDHADEPPRLPVGCRDDRQRRIRCPAGLRRAARHEEARQHDAAADEVHPVARHIELGERHVGRANHQRHHVVAEAADGEGHDAEEHHDGAVHGAELVVELREHDAPRRIGRAEQRADHRNGLHREGELITHQRHQPESEEQKQETRDGVLNPDDLMVLGKNPLRHEALFVVKIVRMSVSMRVEPVRVPLWSRYPTA